MSGKSMSLFPVVLGLLLLVIGAGSHHPNVSLAGDFIFPIGLIWGGVSSDEENVAVRATMLAVGALFVIAAFASSISLGSLLGR
jgi:hypothetical protein